MSERSLADAVIATGFPYDRRERGAHYAGIIGRVLEHVRGIRRFGSAALDLSWVACGRLDGYWEFGLGPWDIGAAMVIVLEAGGVITDHTGNPSGVFDPLYIAGSPGLQRELRSVLAANMPEGWPTNR